MRGVQVRIDSGQRLATDVLNESLKLHYFSAPVVETRLKLGIDIKLKLRQGILKALLHERAC